MTAIKNAAGTTVVTLGDTGVVGGYLVTNFGTGDRSRVRQVVTSPFVDDEFETNSRLGALRLTLDVYIEGSSWSDVNTKRTALLNAVEAVTWQLVIGGVTYVCWAADSSSPIPPGGTDANYRVVSLDIPVRQQIGL